MVQTWQWASGKQKPPPSGKPRRRRRLRVRSRRKGVLASIWLLITALFTISWLTVGGVLWVVASLFAGLATVMLAIATFDPDTAVPATPAKKSRDPSARGKRRSRSRGSSGGTVGGKQRKRACSARCRNSTKPITDCRCSCGGKSHGARHRDP